jgi:deoxyadenosine/deoxycytidine kinase
VLLERIQKRGIAAEQSITADYLENLNNAYTEFFHYYDQSPLLIVNSSEIDLVGNDSDYEQLLQLIVSGLHGVQYFNPKPTLL